MTNCIPDMTSRQCVCGDTSLDSHESAGVWFFLISPTVFEELHFKAFWCLNFEFPEALIQKLLQLSQYTNYLSFGSLVDAWNSRKFIIVTRHLLGGVLIVLNDSIINNMQDIPEVAATIYVTLTFIIGLVQMVTIYRDMDSIKALVKEMSCPLPRCPKHYDMAEGTRRCSEHLTWLCKLMSSSLSFHLLEENVLH